MGVLYCLLQTTVASPRHVLLSPSLESDTSWKSRRLCIGETNTCVPQESWTAFAFLPWFCMTRGKHSREVDFQQYFHARGEAYIASSTFAGALERCLKNPLTSQGLHSSLLERIMRDSNITCRSGMWPISQKFKKLCNSSRLCARHLIPRNIQNSAHFCRKPGDLTVTIWVLSYQHLI